MTDARSQLRDWVDAGHLAADNLPRALELAGVRPDRVGWRTFLDQLLLWLGTVALGAAAIFFLAYNWADLGRFAKFGLAEALIIAALAAYGWQGSERPGGKAALLAAALFTGALLALIGQTYQTGADTFELFGTWAVAILPWMLLGRSAALWIFWLAIANLAVALYFRTFGNLFGVVFGPERQLWMLFALNTMALALWTTLARAGIHWLRERRALRVLATTCTLLITLLALLGIFDRDGFGWGLPGWLAWSVLVYALCRHRVKDVYLLACSVLSAIVVVAAGLTHLFNSADAGAGMLLLIGLTVLGMSAAAGYWLKRVAGEGTTMTAAGQQALWSRLCAAGLAHGDVPPDAKPRSPWFVRAMLGIAGWIGALFLLAFIGAGLGFVVDSPGASIVTGTVICAAALALLGAAGRNEFAAQFGLAASLAGQLLIAYALVRWLDDRPGQAALAIALLQAALFALAPDFLHRVWTALVAALAGLYALATVDLFPLVPPVVSMAFLHAALAEFRIARHAEWLRAAGYGLALAAALVAVGFASPSMAGWYGHAALGGAIGIGTGRLALAIVLIWGTLQLLRRESIGPVSGAGRSALAGAVLVGLIAAAIPGTGPAVVILVIGFANGNRLLTGLGVLALLGCLGHYYYALHATLLAKSALLAASGMTLLAVRFALLRRTPEDDPHG